MRNDRAAQLLGALALAATDRARSAVERSLGRAGAHAAALVHLDTHPGASVQRLADVLRVSQPAAVKVVDRLVEAGFVERRRGVDGRTLALHLTPGGRDAVHDVLAVRAAELEAVLEGLSSAERALLESLLEKLVCGLAEELPGALTVCRLCDREACSGGSARCPLAHTVR